ncbi:unnamed protein product [Rangifer tarandus platyrhynchus]|uniref:Uncharacterized protein n=1 Tax=Rangifer tarandus platyrhynchus TaxID=3082113 RepID=A0ABN8ZJW1_RANTA|nr:unnamed protein product [Rangifer tarandus platyrhynchus]
MLPQQRREEQKDTEASVALTPPTSLLSTVRVDATSSIVFLPLIAATSRPPGGQAGPRAGSPSRQPESASLRAQRPVFPQGSLAPAIGEGTWPRGHGSYLPAPLPSGQPARPKGRNSLEGITALRRGSGNEPNTRGRVSTSQRENPAALKERAPGASGTEREPWVTGDRARTDVRLGRPAGTPSPPRLCACLAAWTSLPLTSSLAQPASAATGGHRAHGKGPPPSALSAGALQAPGAAFNSDLSPWGAAGHRARRAGKVSATP